jgi:1-deoxy-D-xylulose-5-phosphate reductoisomerase
LINLSLLGSTGSIGTQTLDIVSAHREDLRVVAFAAGSTKLHLVAQQILQFAPELVSVPTDADAKTLSDLLKDKGTNSVEVMYGEEGLELVATHPQSQTVVTGVVGFLGLKPTIAAIKKGKNIALANKETLVAAGCTVMPLARKYSSEIIPVDSEHSAIFQSLADSSPREQRRNKIEKLILTASGGPFRTWTKEQIAVATVGDALKHPNWSMGPKITIDSATLMNKGLEIIEARWLFDVAAESIKVVVHPQSILHSAVEFVDGSIVGQLGVPDMRLPIHYALFYPQRVASSRVPRLDLASIARMTFEEPDTDRFPCLKIASEIARHEDTMPCVLNAANEIIVEMFLKGVISFMDIPASISRVLDKHKSIANPELEDILEADKWARTEARLIASRVSS